MWKEGRKKGGRNLIIFGKSDNIQIASVARRPIQKQKCQRKNRVHLNTDTGIGTKRRGPGDSRELRLPDSKTIST